MRKNFIHLLLFPLLTCSFASAQTLVSGGIYANTTWSLANSPYIMTGPVVVFPGKTLTIEPGVEVRVKTDGGFSTGTWHYLEIRGSLVAVGTPSSPITFRGDSLPYQTTWMGIDVKSSQGGTVTMDYFELSNSFNGLYSDEQDSPAWDLHNCVFTYNNYAIQPSGPINFYDCTFRNNGQAIASNWSINHNLLAKRCLFADNIACNGFQSLLSVDSCQILNNGNGIWYTGGAITNTVFEGNAYAIHAMYGTLSNCVFIGNHKGLWEFGGAADLCSFVGNGVAAEVGSGARVTNSTFQDDTVAIAFAGSLTPSAVLPTVEDNRICGSVSYYVENRSNMNFVLDKNCFCETDSAIIETFIFDGYDDFTRGLFNYAIYDSTCDSVLAYVSKVMVSTESAAPAPALSLYPVPAADQLFMAVPAMLSGAGLRAALHDAQGRQLSPWRTVDATEMAWDVSSLPAGMYLLRVEGSTSATLRWVK